MDEPSVPERVDDASPDRTDCNEPVLAVPCIVMELEVVDIASEELSGLREREHHAS